VHRLLEIYEWCEEFSGKESELFTIKTALLLFFTHVFVETNAKQNIRSLKRRGNGILTLDDQLFDTNWKTPLAQRLCDDLDYIDKKFERVDHSDAEYRKSDEFRFVEGCSLFIDEYFSKVRQTEVFEVDKFREFELKLRDHKRKPGTTVFHIDSLAIYAQAVNKLHHTPVNRMWNNLVEGLGKELHIETTKGSGSTIGPGIMKVAIELSEPTEDGDEKMSTSTYSKFLVGCLRDRLLTSAEGAHRISQDQDAQRVILSIIQSVRGMVYLAVAGYSWRNASADSVQSMRHTAYNDLVDAVPINCRDNTPHRRTVLEMQNALSEQGWCILCIQLISMERLQWLHLPCIRLLSAIVSSTGGGSVPVQNRLMSDLTNPLVSPEEVFAKSCRRLLRLAILDLKVVHKAVDVKTFVPTGHGLEVLRVLANITDGAHTRLQDYVVNQTVGDSHHEESYDLVEATVEYLNNLVEKLRESVEYTGRDPVMRDKRHHYFDIMITGLDFLENLCVGPHRQNQERLASTDIISIIHR
jgi:hypothetical protein